MRKSLVLTIIGTDRTGLVESVARTIEKHHGNWVESRMARLAGKFAGVLRVDVDAAAAAKLADALDQLKTQGLTVVVESSAESTDQEAARVLQLELVGHDRPGIVRQVAGDSVLPVTWAASRASRCAATTRSPMIWRSSGVSGMTSIIYSLPMFRQLRPPVFAPEVWGGS